MRKVYNHEQHKRRNMKAYPSIVCELRGSVNIAKTLEGKTFRTRKGKGITVSKQAIPTNPKTPAQTAHREKWKEACVHWHEITDEEKAYWEKEGKAGRISGFNAYMRSKMKE
jgi:hypothetical protein